MIYKIKRFSFMETLKGNPKVKQAFLSWNRNKIDPEIDSDPSLKNVPKELKSYITFLYENIPSGDKGIGGKPMFLLSYENVMNQFEKGKVPISFRKTEEKRIVLGWINGGGSDNFMEILAYYPEENILKITREPARFDLIGRFASRVTNAIFKSDNINHVIPVENLFNVIKANL